VNLSELPYEHPLRNAPIHVIRARFRWARGKTVYTVLPSFKIARSCFNDLAPLWTDGYVWECDSDD
jgi:hypothetical protein